MDLTSYNILLKACSIARRVDLARDIYNETKQLEANGDLRLDVFTYSTMIKVFADAKMWTMALSIKDDMLSAGVVPNTVTWSSLISACAKTGLLDHAVQIFDEMLVSGCKPNTQCCNILLDACVKSCQFDRAFRLYHTWKSAGIKIFDMTKGRSEVVPFTPTVATFNVLMKACGTDLYRPKYLMDEMKTFGLSPNGISWSVLVGLYGTSQNTKGAIEAFRTMQGLGIKLDVIAYTTAIKVCVGNNNLKVAFSLFEEMKRCNVKPDLVTYNTLLRARRNYGSLHEIQQCLTVYQDMRNAGYDANDCHLKELIEEWCEGVIRSTKEYTLSGIQKMQKFDLSKNPNGLLLEKIAAHLRKDSGDNHVIDIRGLSQIESRIVVLSVLWKIRESYRTARKVVQQDMIIMSGVGKGSESNDLEVHLAIIKVLKDDLRLDVATGYGKPIQTIELSADRDDYKQIARRPEDLGVIKVSSKSLCNWLQRKEGQ